MIVRTRGSKRNSYKQTTLSPLYNFEGDTMSEETHDEERKAMAEGTEDEDVYTDEGREALVEDGEISATEAGFMEGAEGDGQQGKCQKCGKAIPETEDVVEKEIAGANKFFCSDGCVEEYEKEHS